MWIATGTYSPDHLTSSFKNITLQKLLVKKKKEISTKDCRQTRRYTWPGALASPICFSFFFWLSYSAANRDTQTQQIVITHNMNMMLNTNSLP